MDIDMSVLRLMEREKDLPLDLLVRAIEEALITAYDKTDGAVPGARIGARVALGTKDLSSVGRRTGNPRTAARAGPTGNVEL